MRIAVIGGSGFIGQWLIRRLMMAGHETVNIDLRVPDETLGSFVKADILEQLPLTNALRDAHAVFLLAAEHKDNVSPVSRYYDVNVKGARNVVTAMSQLGISRLIFTSSVAIYGLDAGAANEDSRAQPFNHYGRSKLAAESELAEWAKAAPARSLTVVRPSVVFGPGNRGNVYNLIKQISGRSFAMIGGGMNRKSMAYVENVAAFLVYCLGTPAGISVFNYADKPDLTMNELVELVVKELRGPGYAPLRIPYAIGLCAGYVFDVAAVVTRRKFPISSIRVRKFCANTLVDSRRAFSAGFVQPENLKQGLLITLRREFGIH